MKIALPSLAATLALAATGAAMAGSEAVAAAAAGTSQQVTVNAHVPSRADHDAVRGSYLLEDGRVLVLSGERRRPVAEIGATPGIALVPLSPTVYAAADGRMRLEFRAHANGVVSAVKVTMAPSPH